MLILFWHNIHRVEKAVSPILTGIEMMAEGKSVKLTEKGELKEINTELNKAVNQLIKKILPVPNGYVPYPMISVPLSPLCWDMPEK